MSIQEVKNKDGTTSFRLTAYDGYKINSKGKYVQVRRYKTFKQPKNMGIRKARQIAKELDLQFQSQFEREEIARSSMTLQEVWESYQKYYAPNKLRDSTHMNFKSIVERKILPQLGHLKIDTITTNRITMFLNDISVKRDIKTGKILKPKQYYKDSYVSSIYSPLYRLFQYAISQGWIKDNPCTNAIKPRKNKSIKKPPLEIEQIKDIINKTHIFSVYNAIIQFQIYTGMRIGETLALTWNDIDFDNLTININKTINYINQEFQVGPPKTDNGYRTIGINKTVLHILELVKQDQNIRKKDLEDVYMDKNLVFSNEIGDYIRRNSVNNHLKVIKKGTNYEYITVHFLRHANATLLLNSGVDLKMVSAHLGHNDIQTTANIYADVLSSQKHKIAQIIEINLENE